MGVLNVTPDSFSDGGDFFSLDSAVAQGREMAAAGAAIIDVGGESTRPGAAPVSAEEEIRRVIPVVGALHDELSIPISIDTSKADVMRAAVAAGAGLINDVRALREPGALEAAVALQVPVCLMHMQGEPRTMQLAPDYADVVTEVREFLLSRVAACQSAGIERRRILIDPGFGFGKDLHHNLALMRRLPELIESGLPLVTGVSRKTMIGKILDKSPDKSIRERLFGSVALASLAAWHGSLLIRAHDVAATVDAITVINAVRRQN